MWQVQTHSSFDYVLIFSFFLFSRVCYVSVCACVCVCVCVVVFCILFQSLAFSLVSFALFFAYFAALHFVLIGVARTISAQSALEPGAQGWADKARQQKNN